MRSVSIHSGHEDTCPWGNLLNQMERFPVACFDCWFCLSKCPRWLQNIWVSSWFLLHDKDTKIYLPNCIGPPPTYFGDNTYGTDKIIYVYGHPSPIEMPCTLLCHLGHLSNQTTQSSPRDRVCRYHVLPRKTCGRDIRTDIIRICVVSGGDHETTV